MTANYGRQDETEDETADLQKYDDELWKEEDVKAKNICDCRLMNQTVVEYYLRVINETAAQFTDGQCSPSTAGSELLPPSL